ncbi:MAG: zinc ABC transporter substrate-binding protein [Bacilli bacterium]|nr:zinc ABC transporter substrate-binding protein [Bacilli bacterium]
MKRKLLIFLFIVIIPFFSGCDGIPEEVDIYASIYPIEFLVKEIVGNKYKVKAVYPRGKDVHDYDVSPSEIISLSKSKIIFYIGLGLEPVIEKSKDTVLSDVLTISLADNLTLIELNSDHYHEGYDPSNDGQVFYDPHVWLDPINMQIIAETILENIIEYLNVEPTDVTLFKENCNNLKSRLKDLDEDFKDVLSDETIINKTIMVDHDAYAYWQLRYGINRIKLRNHNDSPDISPVEMKEKIEQAQALGIKYICTTKNEMESSIIEAYLLGLNLTVKDKRQLHHLGTITAKEEKKEDYFSLMRYNLKILNEVMPRK